MPKKNKLSIDEEVIEKALDEFKDFYAQNEVVENSYDDFSKSRVNDVIVIKVNLSRATLREALGLKKIIDEEINAGCKKLVIDLEQCEFIDTTFLGTLVITLRNMRENEGDLKLIEPTSYHKSLMMITNTFKLFEFYKTQEEAIKNFL